MPANARSDKTKDLFYDFQPRKISKGTILLRKGDICQYGYKVITGCLKSYVIDNSGKEHIVQFAPEEWFISDMDSFFNQKPTNIFIDAIEDSEIIKLDRATFEQITHMAPDVLMEQNNRLVRNIIAANKRLIALLSATAEERYYDFIETYPTLIRRLPLKLIASYIGITPEYLSEIRRKVAKK